MIRVIKGSLVSLGVIIFIMSAVLAIDKIYKSIKDCVRNVREITKIVEQIKEEENIKIKEEEDIKIKDQTNKTKKEAEGNV